MGFGRFDPFKNFDPAGLKIFRKHNDPSSDFESDEPRHISKGGVILNQAGIEARPVEEDQDVARFVDEGGQGEE
ncbi:hypothetical protein A3F65_00115 [Candidatus Saccharibacteria bacterium RIFCSPHIGHO2_12_FULL_47_16b]|nr:MAG: hypothetical protein A3F65_00115 [Candidatus Saccharibacteria bacterium RIFCSPHIGHO2_12_FULL_47_16b]